MIKRLKYYFKTVNSVYWKAFFMGMLLLCSVNMHSQAFMIPVNLQVDVNQIEGLGENVFVNVSSNLTSWSSVPMDDSDGDGIYEKTIYVGAAAGQETPCFLRATPYAQGAPALAAAPPQPLPAPLRWSKCVLAASPP